MSDITLEKIHTLLQRLAEFVMNELPTRAEMNAKLAQKADKVDLAQLATKNELGQLRTEMNQKFDQILQGQDAQARQLDDLRIEKHAISYTLENHEQRLAGLEEYTFGHRVREDGKEFKK